MFYISTNNSVYEWPTWYLDVLLLFLIVKLIVCCVFYIYYFILNLFETEEEHVRRKLLHSLPYPISVSSHPIKEDMPQRGWLAGSVLLKKEGFLHFSRERCPPCFIYNIFTTEKLWLYFKQSIRNIRF